MPKMNGIEATRQIEQGSSPEVARDWLIIVGLCRGRGRGGVHRPGSKRRVIEELCACYPSR